MLRAFALRPSRAWNPLLLPASLRALYPDARPSAISRPAGGRPHATEGPGGFTRRCEFERRRGAAWDIAFAPRASREEDLDAEGRNRGVRIHRLVRTLSRLRRAKGRRDRRLRRRVPGPPRQSPCPR